MKSNDRPLRDVVQEFLKKYRLEDHLEETKLVDQWPGICGPMIASHTSVKVRDKILFVTVDSSALRQELLFMKETLISKQNKASGRELIRDIVFR